MITLATPSPARSEFERLFNRWVSGSVNPWHDWAGRPASETDLAEYDPDAIERSGLDPSLIVGNREALLSRGPTFMSHLFKAVDRDRGRWYFGVTDFQRIVEIDSDVAEQLSIYVDSGTDRTTLLPGFVDRCEAELTRILVDIPRPVRSSTRSGEAAARSP